MLLLVGGKCVYFLQHTLNLIEILDKEYIAWRDQTSELSSHSHGSVEWCPFPSNPGCSLRISWSRPQEKHLPLAWSSETVADSCLADVKQFLSAFMVSHLINDYIKHLHTFCFSLSDDIWERYICIPLSLLFTSSYCHQYVWRAAKFKFFAARDHLKLYQVFRASLNPPGNWQPGC